MSHPDINTIPIVDFSNWTPRNSPEERAVVAKELADACHNVGFVTIINHGISPEVLDEAFDWTRRLFDLQTEQKMLAPHPEGPTVHRGYSWPGLEKVSQVISTDREVGEKLREVVDCKESYEIGSEDNAEQPNIWLPENILPGFRPFMTSFYWQCAQVSHEILRAIADGTGLRDAERSLLRFHSGHNNQLRLLHYPPISAAQLESGTHARMPAHSDWGSITMLFQDQCGGLEAENRRVPGEFVRVAPERHALVMNVGDLLMRWSNDWLKSTLHRVSAPSVNDPLLLAGSQQRMVPARYSIPYFVAPDGDAIIQCMSECVTESNPRKYEPVVQREYQRLRGSLQY